MNSYRSLVAPATLGLAVMAALCASSHTRVPPTAPFIVEGTSAGEARAAIEHVGGKVTGELAIIDGVTAELTRAQEVSLRAEHGVHGVFADAAVTVSAASAGTATSTVADRFDAVKYTNDDGTHRWASPWIEAADDGAPLTGKINVSLNLLPGLTGGGRLNLTGTGGVIARRAAIAPGAQHATLRFDVQRSALEANDFVSVQASRDGFSFTEVGRVSGPANDSQSTRVAFDVSPYISADTTIRFVTGMNTALLDRDTVLLDNLELAYDSVYATGLSYPSLAGADSLHARGLTGLAVTVAVLDTGYWHHPSLDTNTLGLGRVLVQYDAVSDGMDSQQLSVLALTSLGAPVNTDGSGHGSHLSGIILNTERAGDGRFFGIAPDANLVSVRAFDANGRGSYSSVIRGIDWVVRNAGAYRVRVLNLSLGAAPQSRYWEDPLNRAVMRAWQAGIVVVTSAGNTGPAPQTITVPGNVPYVITVGAMTDNYTPANPADDRLTSFSAAGPTYEGFVKPDVVAPGGHVWSLMPTYATIAQGHPAYQNSGDYFTMSGTSQAAAVTSGVVALLLQAQPGLTPDQVKCKLMSSARPAVDASGAFAYSVFQQGAGLIDAAAARDSERLDCANRGLDIEADLAGTQHYGGGARHDAQGQYYLADASGYGWNQGYAWNQSSCNWEDGNPWAEGTAPGTASAMSINAWVAQE